jgi:hypothetical protein
VDEEGGGGVRPATGGWRAAGSGPEPVGASDAGLRMARVCARSKWGRRGKQVTDMWAQGPQCRAAAMT